jgi:hypothetical protein
VREATLEIQGDRAGQRADIDAMAELAEAQDDDRRRAHARWRRSAWAQRIADHAAMEAARGRPSNAASRAGDAELRLLGQRLLAMALAFQGRPAKAQRSPKRRWPKRARWRCAGRRAVPERARVIAACRTTRSARSLDQQSLDAYRAAGDRRNEAIAHGNIGAGWLGLGR